MARNQHNISKLNAINDRAGRPHPNDLPVEDDLSIFTNTNFYDIDIGRSTDIATTVDELLMQQEMQIQYPGKTGAAPQATSGVAPAGNGNGQTSGQFPGSSDIGTGNNGNTAIPGSYNFDFPTLQEFSLAGELRPVSTARHFYPPPNSGGQAFTPAPQELHRLAPRHQILHEHVSVEPTSKSESDEKEDEYSHRDLVRHIADEDKRRRNTAASARFRIKKKLREQEMERTSRQMQSKVDDLEEKVRQLEMENRWLKNLIVERNEKRSATDLDELRSRVLGGANGEAEAAAIPVELPSDA